VQAFGMMGWRVGYIGYQDNNGLGEQLAKVQDTIPICPPQLSQYVALGALQAGRPWVAAQLQSIMCNRWAAASWANPIGIASAPGTSEMTAGTSFPSYRCSSARTLH
jgi:aspartate/methionine/tyrosine aminotransferase